MSNPTKPFFCVKFLRTPKHFLSPFHLIHFLPNSALLLLKFVAKWNIAIIFVALCVSHSCLWLFRNSQLLLNLPWKVLPLLIIHSLISSLNAVLKNARSNVVTLLVSILFRLMSCGFVVSTLSSRQCTRILICLLSGTNCPLSFCFSSKSLPALFYKNSLIFKGFCGSLCTAFSCTTLSLASVCTLTLCKFS